MSWPRILGIFAIFSIWGLASFEAQESFELVDESFNRPLRGGQLVDVRWFVDRRSTHTVRAEFSTDWGETWILVDSDLKAKNRQFIWRVPENTNSAKCQFRLTLFNKEGNEISKSQLVKPFIVDSEEPKIEILAPKVTTQRDCQIEYFCEDNAGGSGIEAVRLYFRLQGQTAWRAAEEDLDTKTPYPMVFDHRGLWDLFLVAFDGAGNATSLPRASDPAQFTIDVQSGEPLVEFFPLKPRYLFSSNGELTLRWKAQDEDLGPNPISLFYQDSNRQWFPIAEKIPNTGSYTWQLPQRDFDADLLKIEVTDLTGKQQQATRRSFVKVDLTPPQTRFVGPRQFVPSLDRDIPPLRLEQYLDDGRGSGVKSLILYWRPQGEKEWKKQIPDLRSIYEKIPFDQGDGNFELILIGQDYAGNVEALPDVSTKPELEILVDRQNPEAAFTMIERQGNELMVSWEARDANLGSLPVTLTWGDGVLDGLPPTGTQSLTLEPGVQEITFEMKVVDLAGRSQAVEKVWRGEAVILPPTPEPSLNFAQVTAKQTLVASGTQATLRWQAKNLNSLEAILFRNQKEVERRVLDPKAQELTWEVKAGHQEEEAWIFVADNQTWNSPVWTVDARAPEFTLETPKQVLFSEESFVVRVNLRDDLAGVAEASLWYRQANESEEKIIALDPSLAAQEVRAPVSGQKIAIGLSVQDAVGNRFVASEPLKFVPVQQPPPKEPILAFADQGSIVAAGSQLTLNWQAQNLNQLEAVLFRNQQEVERRVLKPSDQSLTWTSGEKHAQNEYWVFKSGDSMWDSPVWTVDSQAPDFSLEVPTTVMFSQPEFVVKINLQDTPAGMAKATLWYSTGEWSQKQAIELDPSLSTQQVTLPVVGQTIAIGLSAEDLIGNRLLPVAPLEFVGVEKPPAQVSFVEANRDLILPGGADFELKWKAENIRQPMVLESLEPTGQWTKIADLALESQSHQLKLPMKDLQKLQWRLKHEGQVLAQTRRLVQVDATAPQVSLKVPKDSFGSFVVEGKIEDSGPAGHESAILWIRKQGQTKWQVVDTFKDSTNFSLEREPGLWEFTASIQDQFDRGIPKPDEKTLPMTTITIKKILRPVLAMKAKNFGKSLIRGGVPIPFELVAEDLPEGYEVVIQDQNEQVVAVRREPGPFTIVSPRQSLQEWTVMAQSGKLKTQPLTFQVDFDKPEGELVMVRAPELDQSAKVKVKTRDPGPAGVEEFELYRSDDEGMTWTLLAQGESELDFVPQEPPLHLYLRVRDKVGFWSRAEPSAGVQPDLTLIWDSQDFGFDTFTDAQLYRGGEKHQVRWHGLRREAELQYLPGPDMPWLPLSQVKPGQTSFLWKLPRENTREALLRIVAPEGKELMRVPTPFAIDSSPSSSRLNFLASDVVRNEFQYTREEFTRRTPRSPARDTQNQSAIQQALTRQLSDVQVPTDQPGVQIVEPYDFASYFAAARDAVFREKYGLAARYLESAHRIKDDVAETHDLLAQCYQKMNRRQSLIIDELNRSVELNPRNARAWNHLGVLARLREDPVLARRYFTKALDIEPKPETYLNLGIMNYEDAKTVQAQQDFEKVREFLREKPSSGAYKEATWRLTMLYTYSPLKNVEKARPFWSEVLEIYGRDSWHGKRARKWLRDNDPDS